MFKIIKTEKSCKWIEFKFKFSKIQIHFLVPQVTLQPASQFYNKGRLNNLFFCKIGKRTAFYQKLTKFLIFLISPFDPDCTQVKILKIHFFFKLFVQNKFKPRPR